MKNTYQELINEKETNAALQAENTELKKRIAELEKNVLELKSGQQQTFAPVSIDMHLDRPFGSRERNDD